MPANVVRLTPGADLAAALPPGFTGEIEFEGGAYNVANVNVPAGVMFTRKGAPVTFNVAAGATGLIVGDDFVLNAGFIFSAADPAALRTVGVKVVGKRTMLFRPFFTRFGNKVLNAVALDDAPYALVYQPVIADVAADWNHLYSPHFEFVYGGC